MLECVRHWGIGHSKYSEQDSITLYSTRNIYESEDEAIAYARSEATAIAEYWLRMREDRIKEAKETMKYACTEASAWNKLLEEI